MSNVQQFIDLVGQGQNAQAQESLNDILSAKAFDALEAYKQQVGANLFATEESVQVDEEAEQLDEISLDKASDAYAARYNKSDDGADNKKAFKTKMHIASRYGSTGVNKAIDKTNAPHDFDSETRDVHKSFKRTGN